MPGSVEFNHLLIIFIPLYILIIISDGAGVYIYPKSGFSAVYYPRVARREIG